MTLRLLAASLGIVAALGLAGDASAQEKTGSAPAEREKDTAADKDKSAEDKDKTEKATFGGGCFWSIEAVFERVPGVKSVVSGFAGGNVPTPSYEMVGTGQTGHAEVVQIEYDPKVVTYEKLLAVFWKAHDPTTLNSQGDDFGTQYRSLILYHNDDQKRAALKSYQELKARRAFRNPIVTDLVPFTAFFPAEPYHQDYYRNHRFSDYSQIYIIPKLKKLKLKEPSPRPR
jgi:peptide-methionine (S)-S-oxide reductase